MENLENDLKRFCGTEQYHRITPFSTHMMTDGIRYLADKAGAHWLFSDIAIYLAHMKLLEKHLFQIWKIEVHEDNTATITAKEDSDKKPFYTKQIEYTDFPIKEFEFYVIDKIMLLKSEY